MKHTFVRRPLLPAAVSATLLAVGSVPVAVAKDAAPTAAGPAAAPMIGGALPGGAIVSARSVMLAPVAGGDGVAAPIAGDGSFKLAGLAPGRYRMAISSTAVAKQTQGATFGEKVNAGLASAGKVNDINGGMPNRISMNVTVARQTQSMQVDGAPIEVDVGQDGGLTGRATAQ
jgi:hypothetical protein